jgi:hypothetical protein
MFSCVARPLHLPVYDEFSGALQCDEGLRQQFSAILLAEAIDAPGAT